MQKFRLNGYSWPIPVTTELSYFPTMDLLSEIRSAWGWIGIEPVEVIDQNSFGNLIVKDRSGKFWRLCPEDVYCEVIANDRDELDERLSDPKFLEDWRMSVLVEAAQKNLGTLSEGCVFCLTIPGALGGAYDISNVKAVPIIELLRFSGDLGKQIQDLSDGERIQIKVTD